MNVAECIFLYRFVTFVWMAVEGVYQYLPTTSSFRVLILEPATSAHDDIVGRLEVASLDDAGTFEALSYTWGPAFEYQEPQPSELALGQHRLAIGGNLNHALRRLRLKDASRRVWIDAICIDQSNIAERTQQVSVMHIIYQRATSVVVWVGEDSEEREGLVTLRALEYLHGISKQTQSSTSTHEDEEEYEKLRSQLVNYVQQHDRDFDRYVSSWVAPPSRAEVWAGLVDLDYYRRRYNRELDEFLSNERDHKPNPGSFYIQKAVKLFSERRYFSRQWIIQELFFAKNAVLTCGGVTIPLKALTDSTDSKDHLQHIGLRLPTDDILGSKTKLTGKSSSDNAVAVHEMLDLLCTYFNFQCFDPRDKLYSLLNIDGTGWMQPDYSLSVIEAYTAFARESVRRGKVGRLLDIAASQWNVDHDSRRQSYDQENLPSWIPDWRLEARPHHHTVTLDAVIDNSSSLIVKCRRLGVFIENQEAGPRLVLRVRANRTVSDKSARIKKIELEETTIRVAFTNEGIKAGDEVFELNRPSNPRIWHVKIFRKRDVGQSIHSLSQQAYCLVGSGDLWYDDTRRGLWWNDREIERLSIKT